MLDTKIVDLTKPVTDGQRSKIRIIATDRKDPTYPVVALVEGEDGIEVTQFYTKDGRFFDKSVSICDLVNKKETYEGSVFVVIMQNGNSHIYNSRSWTSDQIKAYYSVSGIKAIVEVPWKCSEGDGL